MPNDALHVICGLTLLAACGGAQATSTVQTAPEVRDLPPQLEAEYRAFATNCNKCHGIERALTAPVTDRRHWEIYVGKMQRTPGSGISTQEAPQILAFLYWYADRKAGRPTQFDREPSAPEPAAAEPAVAPPPAPALEQDKSPASAPTEVSAPAGESTP